MASNTDDAEVFVYMGEGGAEVPDDVVRVRVDPSVTSIPARAFERRKKLTEVELCEGVVEIGQSSFGYCCLSIIYRHSQISQEDLWFCLHMLSRSSS
jgi:hypothetical protein